MNADELRAEWPFGKLVDKTGKIAETAESVPLPISRRTAVEGGDVSLQYAAVGDGDEQPVIELSAAAKKVRHEALQAAYAPPEQVVETAAFKAFDALVVQANGERVPLPISRRTALKGGDVTLRFVAVEEMTGSASTFPATHELPTGISVGRPAETPASVEFANYVTVAEKAGQIDLWASPEKTGVSTAAMDDPGPIVSATRFSRADLPVFLLKKPDGTDETLP
jgi:hypothetical protein